MELLLELNWLAIIVAALVSFAIGYPWYGPIFGKAWLAALGKTADEIEPSPKPFIISIVTTLVTAFVMAVLIACLGIQTWYDGAILGLAVGIGFIAASNVSDAAFCGWSWNLVMIQSSYRIVYSVVTGIILGVWQ
ncbi:MAG: DUF1761 domain-containing protein [Gammaproteobacteria bacterium]|nr:DUF1761 domain-containing protein [Gammaproteobacteria bacterium]